MEKLYHNISSLSVVKILNTDAETGLSKKEVSIRKISFGKNTLSEVKNTLILNYF